jgi:hypothetical protein
MSVKADIKQALLFAFSLVRTVHLPLFGLDPTPVLDFGLAALFTEAQYLSIDRLVATLKAPASGVSRRQMPLAVSTTLLLRATRWTDPSLRPMMEPMNACLAWPRSLPSLGREAANQTLRRHARRARRPTQ